MRLPGVKKTWRGHPPSGLWGKVGEVIECNFDRRKKKKEGLLGGGGTWRKGGSACSPRVRVSFRGSGGGRGLPALGFTRHAQEGREFPQEGKGSPKCRRGEFRREKVHHYITKEP